MDDGKLAFLDEEVTTTPQEPVVETAPAEPATPGQADTGATASPPEAGKEEQPHSVPLVSMLDEREKRQIAQRERDEMQRERDEARRKLAETEGAKANPIPDPAEDPRAFAAYQHQAFEQRMWNERLNMSEAMARQALGDGAVDAARDAFAGAVASSPALFEEMRRSQNPYAFVVQWHKQQQVLSEVGADPAAYKQRIIDEYLAANPATPAPPAQPQKPNLPPSMATAPSAGADTITKGNMFDQMIG